MASSFKFHSSVPEIVPWQAQYQYPSQSNKVRKQTVKLVPKNGSTFSQNLITRFELPADGYCNMLNTTLSFDVTTTLQPFTIPADGGNRSTVQPVAECSLPRGGAHNYIKRLRIMYGSLVLEDIQEYKTLVRILMESGVNKNYQTSSGSILEGNSESSMRNANDPFSVAGAGSIARNVAAETGATMISNNLATHHAVSSQQIGGEVWLGVDSTDAASGSLPISAASAKTITPVFKEIGVEVAGTLNKSVTRTFNIQLLSGLLTSKKLLPLKWMASQLAIEITWAPVVEAIVHNFVTPPTISFGNLNLITELLEFDSSYDLAFFEGLNQPTGVPLKFSSWHYHQFGIGGTNLTYQIHERSRSVKAAFAVVRQLTPVPTVDADFFFHNLNDRIAPASTPTTAPLINLGMYFSPATSSAVNAGAIGSGFIRGTSVASATLTSTVTATNTTSLNSLAPIQQYQWRIGGQYYPAQPVRVTGALGQNATNSIARGEEAYAELMKSLKALGDPIVSGGITHWNYTITGSNGQNGEGSKFIMGNSFETPGLGPDSINGINAEEQSDLALYIQSNQGGSISTSSDGAKKLEVFVNYDNLLLIRSGNVVDLVL